MFESNSKTGRNYFIIYIVNVLQNINFPKRARFTENIQVFHIVQQIIYNTFIDKFDITHVKDKLLENVVV